MTLPFILCLTFFAGTGSVWMADALSRALARAATGWPSVAQSWQGAAAGALLATALLYLLPEAIELQSARNVGAVVLAGVAVFFALDRAELWHHGHEHGRNLLWPRSAGGSWAVLAGDALHAFGDGVVIAAAFVADARTGVVAAVAVAAHEIPHHAGDLVLVRGINGTRSAALRKVSIAGSFCVLGGVAGWWLAGEVHGAMPWLLSLAASSFLYVALADLVPQLQGPWDRHEGAAQLGSLLAGMFAAAAAGQAAHAM